MVDKLRQEYEIADTWVSYEIHPETPPEGRLTAEYFKNVDLTPMHDILRARGAEFGLKYAPSDRLSNSRPAILATEFARDHGLEAAFRRRVFEAYFASGLDIGDRAVLLALAAELGLDGGELGGALDAGVHAGRLADAEREARRLGITGVPTFFLLGAGDADAPSAASARIVGAQPLDTFRRALDQAQASR